MKPFPETSLGHIMKLHRRKTSLALFSLAFLAVALALIMPGRKGDDGAVAAFAGNRFGVYSPGSLAEVPSSAAAAMLGALGLETLAEYEDYSLKIMTDLGVGWTRTDFPFDGWRFHEPEHLEATRLLGIEVVGTARPVNNFAPEDLSRFQEEFRQLIRRYPWIRAWQIGNEPNVRWDPSDYARLFTAGQQVVREECPDCRVLLAGVAARFPTPEGALAYYDDLLSEIQDARDDERAFDVFDMHYYGLSGADEEMLATLERYRQLLDAKGFSDSTGLWITETATTGGPVAPTGVPLQTEEQQAAELVRRFTTMLAAGADRVAWARPYENYRYHGIENGYYDHDAIIFNGLGAEAGLGIAAGTTKQAYRAYRTLIGKVDGFSSARRLAPGFYRFGFDDGRADVFVLWNAGAGVLPDQLQGTVLITDLEGEQRRLDAGVLEPGRVPVFVERV